MAIEINHSIDCSNRVLQQLRIPYMDNRTWRKGFQNLMMQGLQSLSLYNVCQGTSSIDLCRVGCIIINHTCFYEWNLIISLNDSIQFDDKCSIKELPLNFFFFKLKKKTTKACLEKKKRNLKLLKRKWFIKFIRRDFYEKILTNLKLL